MEQLAGGAPVVVYEVFRAGGADGCVGIAARTLPFLLLGCTPPDAQAEISPNKVC